MNISKIYEQQIEDDEFTSSSDWHRELVSKLKNKGVSHEDAMEILGEVADYTQRAYMKGVNQTVNKYKKSNSKPQ
jgi:Arc/MetJ-type ribon-helix-helix transcriptional regulator